MIMDNQDTCHHQRLNKNHQQDFIQSCPTIQNTRTIHKQSSYLIYRNSVIMNQMTNPFTKLNTFLKNAMIIHISANRDIKSIKRTSNTISKFCNYESSDDINNNGTHVINIQKFYI